MKSFSMLLLVGAIMTPHAMIIGDPAESARQAGLHGHDQRDQQFILSGGNVPENELSPSHRLQLAFLEYIVLTLPSADGNQVEEHVLHRDNNALDVGSPVLYHDGSGTMRLEGTVAYDAASDHYYLSDATVWEILRLPSSLDRFSELSAWRDIHCLRLGAPVRVEGLQRAPQHNGRTGRIVCREQATGRFQVILDDVAPGSAEVGIKARGQNLVLRQAELQEAWILGFAERWVEASGSADAARRFDAGENFDQALWEHTHCVPATVSGFSGDHDSPTEFLRGQPRQRSTPELTRHFVAPADASRFPAPQWGPADIMMSHPTMGDPGRNSYGPKAPMREEGMMFA